MRHLVTVILAAVLVPTAFAGVSYRFDSSSSGFASQTISGVVKADQGKVRIDVTTGDGLMFESGSVMFASGGGPITVANPADKTYYEIDPSNLLGSSAGAMTQLQGLVNIDARNSRVSVRDGGNSGAIEGYATRRTLVDTSYDLVMDMFGQKTTTTVATSSEVWWTADIPAEYANVFQTSTLRSGFPAIDKVLASQSANIKGFPLKQVTTTTMTINGGVQRSTSTTAVTGLKQMAIPPADLVMPSGYRKVDSPIESMMGKLGR